MTRAAVLAAAICLLLGAAIRHAAQRPCPEPYVEDGVQPADPWLYALGRMYSPSPAGEHGLGDSEPWGPA